MKLKKKETFTAVLKDPEQSIPRDMPCLGHVFEVELPHIRQGQNDRMLAVLAHSWVN